MSDDLALPGIHIPEQYGGAGFGMVELCIVTEELGRALLCAPYFSTAVLAANAILNAGTEAQKSALLPDLASGARLATLAITELNGNWDPRAIELYATPACGRIRPRRRQELCRRRPSRGPAGGRGAPAQNVRRAKAWRCSHSMRSAGGVERRLLESMDPTRKIARIDFHGAHAELLGSLDDGAKAIATTLDQAAIALANEMVGGAQAAGLGAGLHQDARAVRPHHRLVPGDQAQVRRHAARCRAGEVGGLLRGPAAAATIRNGPRSPCWPRRPPRDLSADRDECIQIHGGIGFTWDNDTHLWFKRAKSSEVFLGEPNYHRELMMQRWGV